jgi:hypothetical protein
MLISPAAAAEAEPGSELWEAVSAMVNTPRDRRGLLFQLLAAVRHWTWLRLHPLRMPVQVQHGTADPIFPFATGAAIASYIPGARFVPREGYGHAPGLECAQGRLQQVSDVIRDIAAENDVGCLDIEDLPGDYGLNVCSIDGFIRSRIYPERGRSALTRSSVCIGIGPR